MADTLQRGAWSPFSYIVVNLARFVRPHEITFSGVNSTMPMLACLLAKRAYDFDFTYINVAGGVASFFQKKYAAVGTRDPHEVPFLRLRVLRALRVFVMELSIHQPDRPDDALEMRLVFAEFALRSNRDGIHQVPVPHQRRGPGHRSSRGGV